MKGKFAVVGTLALLLAAAGPAAAQEAHRDITLEPGKALMEVKVPSQRLYDQLYSSYDFVEAVQRNGDGSLSTDVLVNPGERALAAGPGRPVREDARDRRRHRAARGRARRGGGARGARAEPRRDRLGVRPAAAARARSRCPARSRSMRAYTFTNYAGRFLYVEAHTKAATPVTPNSVEGSPVDGAQLRRRRRRVRRRVEHADLPRHT